MNTYYVYMTLNIINYKKYIGITKKPIKSGYIGSGHQMIKAIKKYGKDFFVRHDLFIGSLEDASEIEKFYIDYYKAVDSDDFYNLREGGFDGPHGELSKQKMKNSLRKTWLQKREKYLESFKHRRKSNALAYDRTGGKNPMFGRNHSKYSIEKISKSKKGVKMKTNSLQRSTNARNNPVLMGNKTNKQKAKNRWAALSKTFSKDPVISDDIRMMHDYYGFHEAVDKLPKEHLLEFLKFRFNFLKEELNEGLEAIDQKNPEEVCDSLIDLIVVAIGTLDLYKVDFKKAWYEVLQANMNKEVGVKPTRPNQWGLPDLIKTNDWVPPSHEGNHGLLSNALDKEDAGE